MLPARVFLLLLLDDDMLLLPPFVGVVGGVSTGAVVDGMVPPLFVEVHLRLDGVPDPRVGVPLREAGRLVFCDLVPVVVHDSD